MRVDLLHERLRRAIVLVADADAYRGQVVDEEVDPVIRRDDDEEIRPARRKPPSDLVEAGFELLRVRIGHLVPIARDDRPVTGREHADEASHGWHSP
jgi:hypothetical protein